MVAPRPLVQISGQSRDARFPQPQFDPKAFTRASWEPSVRKPKPDGPLVSFNRHPDAHMVLSYRTNNFSSMSPRTKGWIKGLRIFQLFLRVLELVGAAGILTLMIMIKQVDESTGWIMRITPGIAIAHCCYAIYHLSRRAGGRTPSSSAAYQLFAAVSDIGIVPLYAFSALAAHNNWDSWATLLADQSLIHYFVPALYYTLIGAGGMHLASLFLSCWLGWMFRKISLMPPDMNPLEDNLTARPKHKRNKSSMTTLGSAEDEKRLSTPIEARRRSGMPYEPVSRPTSMPFMHTRGQSSTTLVGSRGSRNDLPSRQYQVVPNSPRNSTVSKEAKRTSVPSSYQQGSYTEIPLNEDGLNSSRPGSSSNAPSPSRTPRFTETWIPTDSIISRTNQRNRELAAAKASAKNHDSKSYQALSQPYNADDLSDEEYNDENVITHNDIDADGDHGLQPHPLRLNPPKEPRATPPRANTPFYPPDQSLSEVSSNARRVSTSQDIADEQLALGSANSLQRNRQSSIQPEAAFYSRPYGELQSATPPLMVGNNSRKVSSGNDFDSKYTSAAYERRNVSGKVVEEGRGGTPETRTSRYLTRSQRGEWFT
ncbi:hypothetical protein G7046_g4696 [Stylonectria norvegica]|nr:hypothetical protein G7046_g4696 [Stylonectria norvegica]